MADSTSPIDRKEENENFGRLEAVIKDTEVLVTGGLTEILLSSGEIENAGVTAGSVPSGIVVGAGDGDNTSTGLTGNTAGTKRAITRGNTTINSLAVTGASAASDFGKLVYFTDNQTATLTKPTSALPHGFVKRWISSTLCDVTLFTLAESIMWSMIPQNQRIYLGYVSAQSLGGTGALDLLLHTAKSRMLLTQVSAFPCIDDLATAGAQTFTVEIGAVNCTGTLALGFGDCNALADMGTEVTQALTGTCTAAQGDIITLELVASGTGFTDDTVAGFNFYLDVTLLPGS